MWKFQKLSIYTNPKEIAAPRQKSVCETQLPKIRQLHIFLAIQIKVRYFQTEKKNNKIK